MVSNSHAKKHWKFTNNPSDVEFYVRANLTSQAMVEALYYSSNYVERCVHCMPYLWNMCSYVFVRVKGTNF